MQTAETVKPDQQLDQVSNDKTLAVLAHLGGIVLGFIPALIIYLMKKDDRTAQYVTMQAKEALNFQITVAIAMVASSILIVVLIGALLLPLVWIADIVFCVIAAVKTSNGENYQYPATLRLIK